MKKVLFAFILTGVFLQLNSVSAQIAQIEDGPNTPVFQYSGQPGTFDQMRVFSQDIVKVGGEYWMYYAGVPNGNSSQIGLAKSVDGFSWTRHSISPIFKCGENRLTTCRTGTGWSE